MGEPPCRSELKATFGTGLGQRSYACDPGANASKVYGASFRGGCDHRVRLFGVSSSCGAGPRATATQGRLAGGRGSGSGGQWVSSALGWGPPFPVAGARQGSAGRGVSRRVSQPPLGSRAVVPSLFGALGPPTVPTGDACDASKALDARSSPGMFCFPTLSHPETPENGPLFRDLLGSC